YWPPDRTSRDRAANPTSGAPVLLWNTRRTQRDLAFCPSFDFQRKLNSVASLIDDAISTAVTICRREFDSSLFSTQRARRVSSCWRRIFKVWCCAGFMERKLNSVYA